MGCEREIYYYITLVYIIEHVSTNRLPLSLARQGGFRRKFPAPFRSEPPAQFQVVKTNRYSTHDRSIHIHRNRTTAIKYSLNQLTYYCHNYLMGHCTQ